MRASNTDNRGILWAVWAVFTAVIAFVAARHEPFCDEYHVWFMCKYMSLPELWNMMTEEGHFILWHLLIYPFVKLGCSFWCLQLVSVCVVSVGAWFLLMKAPFDTLSKCLVLFSYPMLYQFPVIARCYALIPVILFVIAWLYQSQERHMYLYCFFVGLLAHTHAYMEGMVGALFLLFCYERIYLPRKEGKDTRRAVKAASLTVFVVLLAFLQVSGSLQYAHEQDFQTKGVFELIASLLKYTYRIPDMEVFQLILPKAVVAYIGFVCSVSLWIIICYVLLVVFCKTRENRPLLYVLIASVGWQFWMSSEIYYMAYQREYLPMLVIVFLLWILYESQWMWYVRAILLAFFLLTFRGTPLADIRKSYCDDLAIYAYVEQHIPAGESLYFTAYPHTNLALWLFPYDYDVRLMEDAGWLTSPEELTEDIVSEAFERCGNKDTLYMFTDRKYSRQVDGYHLKLMLDTVWDSLMDNSTPYYIYQVKKSKKD